MKIPDITPLLAAVLAFNLVSPWPALGQSLGQQTTDPTHSKSQPQSQSKPQQPSIEVKADALNTACALLLLPTPQLRWPAHSIQQGEIHTRYNSAYHYLTHNQNSNKSHLERAHNQGLQILNQQIIQPLVTQFLNTKLRHKLVGKMPYASTPDEVEFVQSVKDELPLASTSLDIEFRHSHPNTKLWTFATTLSATFAGASLSLNHLNGDYIFDLAIAGVVAGVVAGPRLARVSSRYALWSKKLVFDIDYTARFNTHHSPLPQSLKCRLVLLRKKAKSVLHYATYRTKALGHTTAYRSQSYYAQDFVQIENIDVPFKLSCQPSVLSNSKWEGGLHIQAHDSPSRLKAHLSVL